MLLIVDTKGASHIAINVPLDGADKSLPAIAAMFEQNAVFINKQWRDASVVKPEISITLGNEFIIENSDENIAVTVNGAVLTDEFVIRTPDVLISNKKAIEQRDSRIKTLELDIAVAKSQLETANAKIKELQDADDVEGLR